MTQQDYPNPHTRRRWFFTAMAAFLIGYGVILVIVAWYFVLPAVAGAREADPLRQQWIGVYSLLMLIVLLVMLLAGIIMVFRIRRFFFPRGADPGPTRYSDAWAESARRTNPPQEKP